MTQACTSTPNDSALQTMVDDPPAQIGPNIKVALIFKDQETILAKDDNGPTKESANKFNKIFNEIENKKQKIGGLQSLTVLDNGKQ
jgi:hypothetical protein